MRLKDERQDGRRVRKQAWWGGGKGTGFAEEFIGVLCSQQEEMSVEVL